MSWVTVIWSVAGGASLALAGLHCMVWFRDRHARASLMFALTALAIIGVAICELGAMHARTPEAWGAWLKWMHLPAFFAISGAIVFVHLHLGTGRLWLAALAIGIRLVSLVFNFCCEPNINYHSIASVRVIPFLGDRVTVVGDAVPNHWMWLAQSSFVLWLAYTTDATIGLLRRGGPDARRRALMVGGNFTGFALLAGVVSIMATNTSLPLPLIPSLGFQFAVLAVGYELSRDVLRAARLSRDLHTSEQRLNLAATAAQIVLWEWHAQRDEIWLSTNRAGFFSADPGRPLNFEAFAATLHPEDRAGVLQAIRRAVDRREPFAAEYRHVMPDGSVRWIAGRGSAEQEGESGEVLLRGVSVDVTERRQADDEIHQHRNELAHLARVASLGELSGSLAHELNQPLAIILSNAQAAQRFLALNPPDVAEVRAILNDIVNADRRAGDVIKRLRALLKRGEPERQLLQVREVVAEVLALMRSDFIARGVSIHLELGEDLPAVSGDRIPLQQVLLNLFTNACDAMNDNPPATRCLTITVRPSGPLVHISVADAGCGLPAAPDRLFEPFYTTKPHGLGMGLPICRTIATAHGGTLRAEANPGGGAIFHLDLPVAPAS